MADSSKPRTPSSLFHKALMPQEELLEIGRRFQGFTIGLPRESQAGESRIALTPFSVEMLTNLGHQVFLETGAGEGAHFSDLEYADSGARICDSRQDAFQADVILKVAPPNAEELELFPENRLLISALNVGNLRKEFLPRLMQKRTTAIGFELIRDEHNSYPVVRSMSEIAGSSSILIAAEYLSNVHGGKGKILGGITGVNPAEVVILGAGTAGEYAARTALGLGAVVKVFDSSFFKLRRLESNLSQRIYTSVLQPKVLENALRTADVAIGAIHLIEQQPSFLVSEEMVRRMKPGSVIIDISIDQGGCFETSEITSHEDPVFRKHGVIHYGVPNIASRVSRTASYGLSNFFGPMLVGLGDAGSSKFFLKINPGVRKGTYLYNGILTNPFLGRMFGIDSRDIELLMAAF